MRELQEKLQKELTTDFERKIEELFQKHKSSFHTMSSGFGRYLFTFLKRLDRERKEYLQQVIKKILKKEKELFPFLKLSNETYIRQEAKKLTQELFEYIHNRKKSPLSKGLLTLLPLIEPNKNYYTSPSFLQNLKEDKQRVFFLTWPLPNEKFLGYTAFKLIELLANDDIESSKTTQQNVSDELGKWIFEGVKKAYGLQDILVEDLDELLSGYVLLRFAKEIGWIEIKKIESDEIEDKLLRVRLSKEFLNHLTKKEREFIQKSSFRYEPMVIEPLDWQGMWGGGYLPINEYYHIPLLKFHNNLEKRYYMDITFPEPILQAINFLQKTPYVINHKILQILEYYIKNMRYFNKNQLRLSYKFYKLLYELYFSEEKLYQKILTDKEKESFIKEKLNKKKVAKEDKKIFEEVLEYLHSFTDKEGLKEEIKLLYELSKFRNTLFLLLQTAHKYKKFDSFYFAWHMDFRGRLYPIQNLLHPQGPDHIRALLLFGNKQKLTSQGKKWFFIHGANTFGEVDKHPFDERIIWVENHKEDILRSAKDPLNESFWKRADEPWRFLAFCFEFERYITDPDNFTTALPVAIDGSNNGFQHISALLRDIQSAKKVNVLPGENGKIADFYNEIKEALVEIVQKGYQPNKDLQVDERDIAYEEIEIEDRRCKEAQKLIEQLENFDIEKNLKKLQTKDILTLLKVDKTIKEEAEECEKEVKKELQGKPKDIVYFRKLKRNLKSCIDTDILGEFEDDLFSGKVVQKGDKYFKKDKKIVKESLINLIDPTKIDRKFVKKPVMTHAYGSSTKGKAKIIKEYLTENPSLLKAKINEYEKRLLSELLAKKIEQAIEKVSKSSIIYLKFMQKCAQEITKVDHIRWTTPLGFEVRQFEVKMKKDRFFGRLISFQTPLKDENGQPIVNPKEHKKGIAPNFIHSIDATHLYLTLLTLKKQGIKHILPVHDSFATLPNDVETLSKTLRQTFKNLHEQEILRLFKKEVENRYSISCQDFKYVDEEFPFQKVLDAIYMFA